MTRATVLGQAVHSVVVGRVLQCRFNRIERRWHMRWAGTVAKDQIIQQLLKQVAGIEAFSQSEEGKQQGSDRGQHDSNPHACRLGTEP